MDPSGNPLARFDLERSAQGSLLLAGVDEAGRGSWAGPVVAAAVILPSGWCPAGLNDSKQLSPKRREKLHAAITANAVSWTACAIPAGEIDRVNILQATLLGMARAVARLRPPPDLVLIDGTQSPPITADLECLIKGDGTSAAIAAASIVAKVLRDRIMVAWDRRFPGYGFAGHKGYGAASHREALAELGPCPLHRRSFRPVAQCRLDRLF